MITEGMFHFDLTPKGLAVGVADQISTNVYNAGAAKRVFQGFSQKPPVLAALYKITAGTGVLSIRVRFVGADDAALTTNVEIIADTGVQTRKNPGPLEAGAGAESALAIGDTISFALPLLGQRTAKQYYGCFYTQGTADQDGEATAVIVEAAQSNMPYRKAAVP